MIEEVIDQRLRASPGITGITGERIYHAIAPQGVALPYLVWSIVYATPVDQHDGPAELDETEVQFSGYAASAVGAAQLRNAVRSALEAVEIVPGASSVVGAVRAVDIEGEYDVYRADIDMIFTHPTSI